ncbi:MAG: hypothetical protein WC565_05715 [Parcubacteria group bacterium]
MRTMVNYADKVRNYYRVKVTNYNGDDVDISDRLQSISGSDDIDNDTPDVSLTFANAYSAFVDVTPNVNLDPNDETSTLNLVGAVYHPLLARYNRITVETSKDAGAHWYIIFDGFVGPGSVGVDTDVEGDDIIVCNPVGMEFPYKDDYWYDSIVYTDADAVSIMSQMFADRLFNQTVVEIDAPAYNVEEYETGETNLWESQLSLIEPTGYIYRICYDPGSVAFKPCVYDPGRDNTTPDWTCDGEFSHRKADLDESGVRTEVIVFYRQATTGAVLTASASDDAARLEYGIPDGFGGRKHKTMWYAAKGSGNRYSAVDSAEEAAALADMVLSDVKAPSPDTEHKLPYINPAVELHDMVLFVGRDYSALVGVTGYSWSASVDDWIGEMTIKGTLDRVVGQYKKWTAKDAKNPEVREYELLSTLRGDGLRPPRLMKVTGTSYKGVDSTTGRESTVVVFSCEECHAWDLSSYVWQYWLVGENKVTTVKTDGPTLVIKDLPMGADVVAQVWAEDWSQTGG